MTSGKVIYKVILIGDPGTGKSCLLSRYVDNIFQHLQPTMCLDFKQKNVTHNGQAIQVQVWDTAGMERTRALTKAYYRGADAILLCYDVTDVESFDSLNNWVTQYNSSNERGESITRIIVANKMDDQKKRKISKEDGVMFATSNNHMYLETSSKTGENVETLFDMVIKQIYETKLEMPKERTCINIASSPSTVNSGSKCCFL